MAETSSGVFLELRAGWSTLAGATVALAFSASALPFYTAGLFIGGFEKEFGWDRTAWAIVATVRTLTLAAIAPLAGGVVDRFGVRGPGAVSFAALAFSFYLMSQLSGDFWQYAAIQVTMTVCASAATTIAFTRPINVTFDRARGLALGVAIGGIGLTAFLAPPLVGRHHRRTRLARRVPADRPCNNNCSTGCDPPPQPQTRGQAIAKG